MKQYQKQFDECNQDFDLLFSSDAGDEDFYRKIIEPGHIYETGYPRCICWQDDDGKDKCECSRQAIIYLYSQLRPNREITVETNLRLFVVAAFAVCIRHKVWIPHVKAPPFLCAKAVKSYGFDTLSYSGRDNRAAASYPLVRITA